MESTGIIAPMKLPPHRQTEAPTSSDHPYIRHNDLKDRAISGREAMMNRWWLAAAPLAVVGPVNAADLSLERIMLSSGGVGYFEYEAVVDGNAPLSLDVPLDQVDDIRKSLVVYDDNGTAGEVTLPGREPLTQSFVDLPFDRAALDSAPALLNALQGAEVRVTGAKPMSGRVLRVVEETARGADGLVIPRDRVTLLT